MAATSLQTVNLTAEIGDLPKHQKYQYILGQTCSIWVSSTNINIENIFPVFSRCTLCNKEKESDGSFGTQKYHCDFCCGLLTVPWMVTGPLRGAATELVNEKEILPFEAKIARIVVDYLDKMRKNNVPMEHFLRFNVTVISK